MLTRNCRRLPSSEATGESAAKETRPRNWIVFSRVKLEPKIVTKVPIGPEIGERLAIVGILLDWATSKLPCASRRSGGPIVGRPVPLAAAGECWAPIPANSGEAAEIRTFAAGVNIANTIVADIQQRVTSAFI